MDRKLLSRILLVSLIGVLVVGTIGCARARDEQLASEDIQDVVTDQVSTAGNSGKSETAGQSGGEIGGDQGG